FSSERWPSSIPAHPRGCAALRYRYDARARRRGGDRDLPRWRDVLGAARRLRTAGLGHGTGRAPRMIRRAALGRGSAQEGAVQLGSLRAVFSPLRSARALRLSSFESWRTSFASSFVTLPSAHTRSAAARICFTASSKRLWISVRVAAGTL